GYKCSSTLLRHFRITLRGNNDTFAGLRSSAGLDAVYPRSSDEVIRIAQEILENLATAIERDFSFLLRDIKPERSVLHRIGGEFCHIECRRVRLKPFARFQTVRINEKCSLHAQFPRQGVHLGDECLDRTESTHAFATCGSERRSDVIRQRG